MIVVGKRRDLESAQELSKKLGTSVRVVGLEVLEQRCSQGARLPTTPSGVVLRSTLKDQVPAPPSLQAFGARGCTLLFGNCAATSQRSWCGLCERTSPAEKRGEGRWQDGLASPLNLQGFDRKLGRHAVGDSN